MFSVRLLAFLIFALELACLCLDNIGFATTRSCRDDLLRRQRLRLIVFTVVVKGNRSASGYEATSMS